MPEDNAVSQLQDALNEIDAYQSRIAELERIGPRIEVGPHELMRCGKGHLYRLGDGCLACVRIAELERDRDQWKAKAEKAEVDAAEAKNALMVSEQYRRAYADGKYKLYSMGGEICEAAAEHLPCSEGPLDRYTAKIEREHSPRLVVERNQLVNDVETLTADNARLREALEKIHKGAFLTAQESCSRDDDRYCIGSVIDVASAALAATGHADPWRPIDTAPRNLDSDEGVHVINARNGCQRIVCWSASEDGEEGWGAITIQADGEMFPDGYWTHWIPLPEPPKVVEGRK